MLPANQPVAGRDELPGAFRQKELLKNTGSLRRAAQFPEVMPTSTLIPASAPLGFYNVSKLIHGGSNLIFRMVAAQ